MRMLCATARPAAAPAPALVVVLLYALRMSTSRLMTAARASSSVPTIKRSTALFANSVAIATWSADAKMSERLFVVGSAVVMTRMRRSPARR